MRAVQSRHCAGAAQGNEKTHAPRTRVELAGAAVARRDCHSVSRAGSGDP